MVMPRSRHHGRNDTGTRAVQGVRVGKEPRFVDPIHTAFIPNTPTPCSTSADPDAWFADRDAYPHASRGVITQIMEHAAQLCRTRCPVMEQCRSHSLRHGETLGVWGGITEQDRRNAATQRRESECGKCGANLLEHGYVRHYRADGSRKLGCSLCRLELQRNTPSHQNRKCSKGKHLLRDHRVVVGNSYGRGRVHCGGCLEDKRRAAESTGLEETA